MTQKLHMPALPLTGGCQCGAVRYTLDGPPVVFYCCHCTECQKQSASGFGESFRVHRNDLEVTGEIKTIERTGASGATLAGDFCPECGTRLFHRRAKYSDTLNIKAGTLDDTSWLKPAGHIWTQSRQSWVIIPETDLSYLREPGSDDEMIARWQEMLGGE